MVLLLSSRVRCIHFELTTGSKKADNSMIIARRKKLIRLIFLMGSFLSIDLLPIRYTSGITTVMFVPSPTVLSTSSFQP